MCAHQFHRTLPAWRSLLSPFLKLPVINSPASQNLGCFFIVSPFTSHNSGCFFIISPVASHDFRCCSVWRNWCVHIYKICSRPFPDHGTWFFCFLSRKGKNQASILSLLEGSIGSRYNFTRSQKLPKTRF